MTISAAFRACLELGEFSMGAWEQRSLEPEYRRNYLWIQKPTVLRVLPSAIL